MALRGLQFWALADTGYRQRGTFVDDGGGGGTTTYVTVGTVACRIDPLARADGDELVGGRLDERSTHVVTAPSGTQVITADRFEIANRGVYEVTAVRDRTDELSKVFEVVAT